VLGGCGPDMSDVFENLCSTASHFKQISRIDSSVCKVFNSQITVSLDYLKMLLFVNLVNHMFTFISTKNIYLLYIALRLC